MLHHASKKVYRDAESEGIEEREQRLILADGREDLLKVILDCPLEYDVLVFGPLKPCL